jgi:hypothetical protein
VVEVDWIVRTWGAAVLRPYVTAMADEFSVELTAEILRFAQDDSALFFD